MIAVSDEKFDKYIGQNDPDGNSVIGRVTNDGIIPTFEIRVPILELLDGDLRDEIRRGDYLKNIEFYAKIIMLLAKHHYAASTWPTRRTEFSTISIKGWDHRDFEEWYESITHILDRFAEKNSAEFQRGSRRSRQEPSSHQQSSLPRYRTVNELLLIPQYKTDYLKGNRLIYADLRSDNKRAELLKKYEIS